MEVPSRRLIMLSRSRLRKPASRQASCGMSSVAMAQALPSPTIPGTFSVPERMPRSCPPPSRMAESLRSIRVKDHAALMAQFADFLNRLEHANFIIRRHDRNQDGLVIHRPLELVEI